MGLRVGGKSPEVSSQDKTEISEGLTVILKSSESDDESSLKSSFETLENQERLDGHDNFQYSSHLNNTDKQVEPFKRVINGEMKSPDLLVDPEDGKWNPMVVIIASCCIGRIFKPLLDCLL